MMVCDIPLGEQQIDKRITLRYILEKGAVKI
jgi:hypothetical protein